MNLFTILFVSILFFQISCKKEPVDYSTALETCIPDTMKMIKDGDTIKLPYMNIDCILGAHLPEFSSVTMDQKPIDRRYFEGKVSVINFWFEGCKPCEAEMPGFNKLVEKYKSSAVNFLAIGRNSPEDIAEFIARKPFHFDHVSYGEPIIRGPFQSTWGYPVTIVADKQMKIVYAESGGMSDSTAVEIIQKKLIPVIDAALN